MRIDTAEFSQNSLSESQEPAFVVEIAFDDAATDLIYLTSHAIAGLTGEIFESVLTDISGTTQKINPDKALSQIGSLSFSALDDQLTDKQRSKLNAGLGLRGKRARFYAGFVGLDWSTYTLVQTQIIRGASYKNLEYTWRCSDIQREMRQQVFEVKQTSLAATLEADDDEVQVYNTSGFDLVKHPDSPSGRTDAPGQKVGYLILEEDGQKEIIRYTGKTSTTFTGCTRGALGTRPIRVEKSDDEGADNAPKVEEYVYLEMPAPMLAYAVLTGSIYGEAGETLPDHWHLGIPPQYIRTSDYTNIGEDLWDLSNPDLGLPARIAGVSDEDGKQFVEEQLLLLMGCYPPIYANGEIGLRRMTGVLSDASSIRTLDRRNVVKYGALEHDMSAIINRIVISWNWVDQREEYTRTNLLIDQDSIDTHGEATLKQLEFRALHGSRHSYNTLRNRFDALRDRYAGPPLKISLDLMPDQNDLEVGDIVRLKLDEVEDYTGTVTGIDRAFEVQQVKVNWKTGVVSVDLFGSSQPAQPLAPEQEGATLPDAVYAVPGATEINDTNFPGAVSSSGGITTVSADIDLTGSDNLRDSAAIYYCLEDLTINAGVTVTINKNTQIRVRGFFQINGKIDGKARGWPGGQGMDFAPGGGVENFEASIAKIYPTTKGYLGTPAGGGGLYYPSNPMHNVTLIEKFLQDERNLGINGGSTAPELSMAVQDGQLTGLPSTLAGQPGSGGGSVVGRAEMRFLTRRSGIDGQTKISLFRELDQSYDNFFSGAYQYYARYLGPGGDGGNGGAGLFVLCSGSELGISGVIDLSGADGGFAPGTTFDFTPENDGDYIWLDDQTMYGGRGAGGSPGALYFAIVGNTSNPPTLQSSNSAFFYGSSEPTQPDLVLDASETYLGGQRQDVNYAVNNNLTSVTVNGPFNNQPAVNKFTSFTRIQFLNGEIEPAPDIPESSAKPEGILVTEALNTPKTPNANLSTLEVSVTGPADNAYSHALIDYRPLGDPAWTEVGPASPEALITVASDGVAYEVRARSVSSSGVVSEDYVSTTITTTKIIGAEPGDPDVDEKITIPPVNGLELEEQGNDTEFTGRDAKFVWRATSVGEWVELGSEGQLGAGSSELDLYFRDYQVEIWAQNKVVRTAWVKDPAFVYSFEKNAEDYARENGEPGAWRSFEIRVYCRGRLNQVSERPAKLTVSNPAPTNIRGLAITAGFNVIEIVYQKPDDLDFAGVQVWISDTAGFDPDLVEPVATISDNSYVAGGLNQGQNYYVRLRPFDDFGIEGTSPTAEIMVTTRTGQDLDGLSGWAYELAPVDRQFIMDNIAGGAIDLGDSVIGGELPSVKLSNLAVTAGKLADGSIELSGNKITGQLGQINLADSAVTTSKLAELSITAAKLASSSVTATKIANLAVGTAAITNAAITNAKIANLAVGTAQIADAAIDSAKIGSLAVGTAAIQDGAITNVKIGSAAVNTAQIADAAIQSAKIGDLQVTDAKIVGLTAAKLNTGTLNATETITSEGLIRAVDDINNPSIQVGIGPTTLSVGGAQTSLLLWAVNSIGDVTFGVDELGNPYFSGELDAAGGTFGDPNGYYLEFDGADLVINAQNLVLDATGALTLGAGDETLSYDATNGLLINGGVRSGTIDVGGDFTGHFLNPSQVGYTAGADYVSASGGTSGWYINAAGTFQFTNTGTAVPGDSLLDWGAGTPSVATEPRLLSSDAAFVSQQTTGNRWFVGLDGTGATELFEIKSGGTATFDGANYACDVTLDPASALLFEGDTYQNGIFRLEGNCASRAEIGRDNVGVYADGNFSGCGTPIDPNFRTFGFYGVGGVGAMGVGTDHGVRGDGDNFDFYAVGAGSNYGPFTGSHDGIVRRSAEVEPGDIMVSTGVVYRKGISATIPVLARSEAPWQKGSYGVFVKRLELIKNRPAALTETQAQGLTTDHDGAIVNSIGEGLINVCDEGGDFEVGDLISTSSVPGKGKKYLGNDARVIVAKIVEPVDWENEEAPYKSVACIYLCG